MVVARSTTELFDYVPESDRELPPERRTTFHLRRFSTQLHLQALDQSGKGAATEIIIRSGIRGWTNFADADGHVVECRIEKGKRLIRNCEVLDPMALESMNHLSPELVGELGRAIFEGNSLTAADVKN